MRDSQDFLNYNCVILLGPTAMGKTKEGVRRAEALGGEIISADSRQVYKGLDIGTGKDLQEYTVPYHLIDIIDLSQEYNVFSFLHDSYTAFTDIEKRGKIPIIVGGTGLYLNAFIKGYTFGDAPGAPRDTNPRHHTHSGPGEDLIRPDIRPRILGMRCDRPELHRRIEQRLRGRLDAGMVEEVRSLHEAGVSWERLDRLGLEYRFCARYLQGLAGSEADFVDALFHAICRFAKRQETWFRGMERQGTAVEWL